MDQETPHRRTGRRSLRWNGHELAGFWSRFAAAVIDALAAGGLSVLVHAILTHRAFAGRNATTGEQLELVAIGVVVALAYYPPQLVRWRGQTLGKRAMRIRVVRASGAPMSYGVAILREIVGKTLAFGVIVVDVFVPGIAILGLADYLWFFGDRENRTLHDLAADTRVIRDAP
jgi:uncharacterized RDD family membrane protein YckC